MDDVPSSKGCNLAHGTHVCDTTCILYHSGDGFFWKPHHNEPEYMATNTSLNTSCLREELGFTVPLGLPSGAYSPTDVLLSALPMLAVLAVWIVFEAWAAWRSGHRWCFRAASLLVGVVSTAGIGLTTWRLFDILACYGVLDAAWRVIATAVVVITCLLLVAALGVRYPRGAVLSFLLLAGVSVFAGWALHGGVVGVEGIGAAPLLAVQQLLCTNAIVALAQLPGHRRRRVAGVSSTRARGLVQSRPASSRRASSQAPATGGDLVADPLATRTPRGGVAPDPQCTQPPDRWTWFSL